MIPMTSANKRAVCAESTEAEGKVQNVECVEGIMVPRSAGSWSSLVVRRRQVSRCATRCWRVYLDRELGCVALVDNECCGLDVKK